MPLLFTLNRCLRQSLQEWTLIALFWCFYCKLWRYFTPFVVFLLLTLSIINFEHVIACWGSSKICGRQLLKNFKWSWSVSTDHITLIFLKAVFHKFYLVHSWILSHLFIWAFAFWVIVLRNVCTSKDTFLMMMIQYKLKVFTLCIHLNLSK